VEAPVFRMLLAAGVIALLLTSVLVPRLKAADPRDADILMQVLGGTADLAAEKAYQEADVYFHGGIAGGCPDEAVCVHDDLHHRAESAPLPLARLVKRLHGETAPRAHRHLQGEEEKELLPWFVAAVRLNPHHIEAWRTGSYWFYRTGDSQRAEEFIREGICHNPKDYRLYLDRGILYHRLHRWQDAVRDLEVARELWRNDSEDAPFELRAIGTYLRDSRERLQQPAISR